MIVCNRLRQHTLVHIQEKPLLCPGDLDCRGRVDSLSRLPVGPQEPRRRQAAERHWPERLAHGCHDVRDLLVFELPRVRPLLMEIVALALASKGCILAAILEISNDIA